MQNDNGVSWPSAIVGLGVMALVGAIAITGEVKYSVDDFIKVWTALAGLVGVITGAMVTYFFSRAAVGQAQAVAKTAAETAETAKTETRRVTDQARRLHAAMQRAQAAAPQAFEKDPVLQKAVAETVD